MQHRVRMAHVEQVAYRTWQLTGHLLCKRIRVGLLGRRLLGIGCAALARHRRLASRLAGTLACALSLWSTTSPSNLFPPHD